MKNTAMENEGTGGGTTCGDDVTIYVVKSVADEANREKKRRKKECEAKPGTSLGEIHANSHKLRRCSKYFETLMSERWTLDAARESSSRLEFYLEAQTDIFYYQDCFTRMKFPYPEPIRSVKDCIELLKVASQIQCQDVLDMGMKFLAGVAWVYDDEKLIRDFCNSGYFTADSARDLKHRLDLSLTQEERQKQCLDLTKRSLKRYLKFALSDRPISHSNGGSLDSQTVFADAMDVIVAADLKSDMSYNLLEYAITLIKEAAENILISIKDHWYGIFQEQTVTFCWLYHIAQQANASHLLVKLILENGEVLNRALRALSDEAKIIWAGMIDSIFEDLLEGNLLLNTSQRFSLFSDWNWVLKVEYMKHMFNEEELVDFVTKIIMTFPLDMQKEIYDEWADDFDGSILSQSYTAWLMLMVKELIDAGPNTKASEDKDQDISVDKVSLLCRKSERLELRSSI